MKATSSVCIVLIGLFTMPIGFACDEPDNIVIPDGKSKDTITVRENKFVTLHNAASDAMKRTTKSFDQAIEDYKARQ